METVEKVELRRHLVTDASWDTLRVKVSVHLDTGVKSPVALRVVNVRNAPNVVVQGDVYVHSPNNATQNY